MADVVDTTGASFCAQNSKHFDPVNALLDALERQTAGWEALPEIDDAVRDNALRDKVRELSLDETGALLRQVEPTTIAGVIRALRHVIDRIAPDDGGGPDDYTLPLARNAVSALARMAG
jgi:hypothetical protein